MISSPIEQAQPPLQFARCHTLRPLEVDPVRGETHVTVETHLIATRGALERRLAAFRAVTAAERLLSLDDTAFSPGARAAAVVAGFFFFNRPA
jgi:hypothetical protein